MFSFRSLWGCHFFLYSPWVRNCLYLGKLTRPQSEKQVTSFPVFPATPGQEWQDQGICWMQPVQFLPTVGLSYWTSRGIAVLDARQSGIRGASYSQELSGKVSHPVPRGPWSLWDSADTTCQAEATDTMRTA